MFSGKRQQKKEKSWRKQEKIGENGENERKKEKVRGKLERVKQEFERKCKEIIEN